MATKTISVRAQINGLAIGESVSFPIERYEYVVSCRTVLQMASEKRFTSKTDKDAATVTITRDEDKPQ